MCEGPSNFGKGPNLRIPPFGFGLTFMDFADSWMDRHKKALHSARLFRKLKNRAHMSSYVEMFRDRITF